MTILDMLCQSGILTLLGMGVVFSFLIIMIISMNILKVVLHKVGLDKEEKKETPVLNTVSEDKGAIVAAIAASIKQRMN